MFPFIFLPCSFYHIHFTMSLLPYPFYHIHFTIFPLPCSFYTLTMFPFALLPCSLCHVPFSHFYHVSFAMFPFRLLSQHKGTTITPTIVIPACSFFLSNPLLKDHASHSTIFPLPCSPSYFYHVPFYPRLTTKKEQPLLLACSLSERFLQISVCCQKEKKGVYVLKMLQSLRFF